MIGMTMHRMLLCFRIVSKNNNDHGTHHAEGLVNPKVRGQKKVTDFGYPRAELFGPGHFVGLGLRLKSEIRFRTRTRT
jgi:hypothetical protein